MIIRDTEVHLMQTSWQEDCISYKEKFVEDIFLKHQDSQIAKKLNNIDEIIKSCEENEISEISLMGIPWISNDLNKKNNDYLLNLKEKLNFPKIKIVAVFNIDDISYSLDYLEQIKKLIIGLKVQGGRQGVRIEEKKYHPIYDFLIQENLFFMPHINHIIQGFQDTPQALMDIILSKPNLRIIAPHLAGGLFLYEGYDRIKEKLRNVYYITSVSATMYMTKTAMELCYDKIVFGTDFPFNHCHNQSLQVNYIKNNFATSDQEKIFNNNYLRFLDGK